MKYLLIIILLTGCAMSPEEIALKNKQLDMIAAQNAKPTLTCTAGCTYNDPNQKISIPRETNGWDFANTLLKTSANVVVTAAPWLAVSKIAIDGIANAGGNTSNVDSYNQHSEANQQNSADTTTSTTNTATDSYNTTTATDSYNTSTEANPVTTTTTDNTDNSDSSTTTTTTTEETEEVEE